MKKEDEILGLIKKSVREIEPQSEVILFGSRARGDAKEESDWDVLILVPHEVGLKEEQVFRHKLFDIELLFGQAISTLVKSKKEWESKFRITPFYENVLREGINL